ncbi:hypothetical protein KSP39_PZI001078 [Platanthera zijinensis]|uniref:Uncharacterized protein n=1 Tax=Platanthera zijinensis TaxID=2320716 RepID=A0AAP0GF88_9ASPA
MAGIGWKAGRGDIKKTGKAGDDGALQYAVRDRVSVPMDLNVVARRNVTEAILQSESNSSFTASEVLAVSTLLQFRPPHSTSNVSLPPRQPQHLHGAPRLRRSPIEPLQDLTYFSGR